MIDGDNDDKYDVDDDGDDDDDNNDDNANYYVYMLSVCYQLE